MSHVSWKLYKVTGKQVMKGFGFIYRRGEGNIRLDRETSEFIGIQPCKTITARDCVGNLHEIRFRVVTQCGNLSITDGLDRLMHFYDVPAPLLIDIFATNDNFYKATRRKNEAYLSEGWVEFCNEHFLQPGYRFKLGANANEPSKIYHFEDAVHINANASGAFHSPSSSSSQSSGFVASGSSISSSSSSNHPSSFSASSSRISMGASSSQSSGLGPNNELQILIDEEDKKKANFLSYEDFEPTLIPSKTIPDLDNKKPDDWEDRGKIPYLTATKPENWDEDAPIEILDEEAEKLEGWLDDELKEINDPEATKSEDWDDEDDGEWEAPKIDNLG
ncbi:hypothetical protein RIF29_17737 [Crotalaria pallida]|uniref:Uncharacterized protein n=1 Tax=Crotalaria pallida TaxID=3830 RepID=A0AAN9IFK6_CROPI